MCKLLDTTVLLKFAIGPTYDTVFDYSVVDGANGSGKTRYYWEFGKHFVKNRKAQLAFVDVQLKDVVLMTREMRRTSITVLW